MACAISCCVAATAAGSGWPARHAIARATLARTTPLRAELDALVNGFEKAFIEGTARYRLQPVAVLLRVHCSSVCVQGPLILPNLDDGEVIRAHRVLHDVEPKTPLFLTADLRQPGEQPRRVGLRAANRVDMRDDIDGLRVSRHSR